MATESPFLYLVLRRCQHLPATWVVQTCCGARADI